MQSNIINDLIEKQKELGGKKILHFGSLAGWPHTMARVSRDLGVASENWVHFNTDVKDLNRELSFDTAIFNKQDSFIKKTTKRLKFLKDCPENFCLVHYHGGNFFRADRHFLLEGPYLKKNRVPMVLSLGGGEGRLRAFSISKNKYYYKSPDFWDDLRIKMRWLSWRKNIAICATDPEMAIIAEQYFENISIFRQPVELSNFTINLPKITNDRPLLLHVPTEPEVKGTEYILKAVERLKAKGLKFDFKMVRQLTQKEFYQLLSECDVYIDELRCGSHGVTAVESMAMGKPTISYIREDLVHRYPEDLPLVNANPDTIEAVLERLILDAQLRVEIGISSRQYVEKYHDATKVIDSMAAIYMQLLN